MLIKIEENIYVNKNHIVSVKIFPQGGGSVRVAIDTLHTSNSSTGSIFVDLESSTDLAFLLSALQD
ncbi:hypothetical protein ACINWC323_A0072 [Acinetobacter sp. WC-323]|uniref:hypothetical protein n=1 Tax=Acinetobacter sp. WC-323 TaxID=903918 RepID=UPI00029E8FAC|nr:hypothetical protein [Acinetobacter sp. WC-323]EKU50899.1 hypothetical protein ACINWC323_A0072 [Acinetobacter sp. WC-323]